MHLATLQPTFFVTPWIGMPPHTTPADMLEQRRCMGLGFDCPCACGQRVTVAFLNPLDGGPPAAQEFSPFGIVTLTEDTWDGLSLEAVDLNTHGRWAIDRGEVLRVLD
jgi:hypothetical protein